MQPTDKGGERGEGGSEAQAESQRQPMKPQRRHQPGAGASLPLYWPPLTAPDEAIHSHGVEIWPPPQPLGLEQKHTSWAERGTSILPLVAMHIRSDAASAPPNAQQQPHMDWSRLAMRWRGGKKEESKEKGISADRGQQHAGACRHCSWRADAGG